MNVAKVGIGLVYLMMARGFTGVGEYLYALDTRSFRILHGVGEGERPVGAIFGYFEEKAAQPGTGIQVARCPRTALKNLER